MFGEGVILRAHHSTNSWGRNVEHDHGCDASLPLPTPPQVWYQQGEIHALIHFNMATYYGEAGCGAGNWHGKLTSNLPLLVIYGHIRTACSWF